jgi:class 3 adenylate cyclase/tetratricopeptide (TPR) repeat protein
VNVAAWLNGLGLGQYAQAFAENHIDVEALRGLAADDLKELGVASLGHRKRILAAIATLRGEASQGTGGAPGAAAERRQVTILFADLCGFTALTRSIDVEELHDLVGRFTALVDHVIEEYGGSVDKHVGDAVMALFGAPIAHGDDPVRAARAAVDIHAAVEALGVQLGRRLDAHIGIANGEVVAGGLARSGQSEYTVLGNSVNLAARLQAIARPGETIVSETVRQALAGIAECETMGEAALKGFDKPVRAWRVRSISSVPSTPRTPFVGRQAELAQFAGIIDACSEGRFGQTILLRGEAGIGKTRLLGEMIGLAAARGFAVYRALVLDFGVGRGRDPIRALVRSLLAIEPGDDDAARQAADRAIAERWAASEQAAFLNDRLDLPQPQALRGLYEAMDNEARNRGKSALLASLVKRTAARAPALIAVEDVHWADTTTLAYLGKIASTVRDNPVLLAMTTRIEGDPINHSWRGFWGGVPATTIELGPLRRDEAMALADVLIDTAKQSAAACIERAGGNPLFLEQLLRNAEEGADEAVPASIQSLVLARVDRLRSADKQTLQAASVIGQRFDLATLRHVLGAPDCVCDSLVQHGLVHPDGAECLFAHALIQEGVYASMLKARRRELHRRAAEWFADRDSTLRAEHLDRAEDERAAAAYREAAEAQLASYHGERALRLAERGAALARTATERHALLCLRGQLLQDLGRIAESIDAYQQALDAAEDDGARCRAWIGVASAMRISDRVDEALALLDKAEAAAERQDLVVDLARIHSLRGNLYFPLGRIEACRREHERALEYARRAESPEAEARALGGLADAAYAQGRMRTACEHFRRCVELSRQHGFGRIEVANLSMIGFSRYYLNQLDEALEDGLAAANLAARVGHPRAELLGQTIATFALYEMADFERAGQHLLRVRNLCHQLGARRFEAQALEFEARIHLAEGRFSEARQLAAEARAMSREAGLNFIAPRIMGLMALLAADREERDRALEEGESLLRAGAVGHNHLWFYRDAMEAALRAKDWEGAERWAMALEEYTRQEPLPWADFFIAQGRARAAIGRGQRLAAAAADLLRLRDEARQARLGLSLRVLEAAISQVARASVNDDRR